jgi:hypothetical protein
MRRREGGTTMEPPSDAAAVRGTTVGDRRRRRLVEDLRDSLKHPMTLLLVTAAVSGVLVPFVTQQWQEQRSQLEIRRELAARAAKTVGEMQVSTEMAEVGAVSLGQEEFDAAYVRWRVESAVLGAELAAYFPSEALAQAWDRCVALTTAYYVQSGIEQPERRGQYLTEVRDDEGYADEIDLGDRDVLLATLAEGRDDVIKLILSSSMT